MYDPFADERNPQPPKPYRFKLLKPATVEALRKGGYTEILIQFFDSISGAAAALNNSRNPTAAANTMLSDPDRVKTEKGNKKSYTQMISEFVARRHARNATKAEVPAAIDALFCNPHLKLESPVEPEEVEDEA